MIFAGLRRQAVPALAGFVTFAAVWATSGTYVAGLYAGISVLVSTSIVGAAFHSSMNTAGPGDGHV